MLKSFNVSQMKSVESRLFENGFTKCFYFDGEPIYLADVDDGNIISVSCDFETVLIYDIKGKIDMNQEQFINLILEDHCKVYDYLIGESRDKRCNLLYVLGYE